MENQGFTVYEDKWWQHGASSALGEPAAELWADQLEVIAQGVQ